MDKPSNQLRRIIFDQARDQWRGWLRAKHSTQAERQIAELAMRELDVMATELDDPPPVPALDPLMFSEGEMAFLIRALQAFERAEGHAWHPSAKQTSQDLQEKLRQRRDGVDG